MAWRHLNVNRCAAQHCATSSEMFLWKMSNHRVVSAENVQISCRVITDQQFRGVELGSTLGALEKWEKVVFRTGTQATTGKNWLWRASLHYLKTDISLLIINCVRLTFLHIAILKGSTIPNTLFPLKRGIIRRQVFIDMCATKIRNMNRLCHGVIKI